MVNASSTKEKVMKTKVMTVAELADALKMDKLSVNGFLSIVEALGGVKKVGTRKVDGARGKPSNLFEVPEKIGDMVMWTDAPVTSIPVTEIPVTEIPAVAEAVTEAPVTEAVTEAVAEVVG